MQKVWTEKVSQEKASQEEASQEEVSQEKVKEAFSVGVRACIRAYLNIGASMSVSMSVSIISSVGMLGLCISLLGSPAQAEDKISMNYVNEDLIKIIEVYAKQSKQKFIVDAGVRGKVSILLPEPVSITEAFHHLSSALAINGYAISTQGDTMVIKSARNIQRDLHEVSPLKPTLKPERMYTWIYQLKHVSAAQINRDLRILPSKDGEFSLDENQNQLLITDWVSNLWRIADVLKEIDRPVDPKVSQIVEAAKKARQEVQLEKKATGHFRVSGTPKPRPGATSGSGSTQQALPPPPPPLSEDEQ